MPESPPQSPEASGCLGAPAPAPACFVSPGAWDPHLRLHTYPCTLLVVKMECSLASPVYSPRMECQGRVETHIHPSVLFFKSWSVAAELSQAELIHFLISLTSCSVQRWLAAWIRKSVRSGWNLSKWHLDGATNHLLITWVKLVLG